MATIIFNVFSRIVEVFNKIKSLGNILWNVTLIYPGTPHLPRVSQNKTQTRKVRLFDSKMSIKWLIEYIFQLIRQRYCFYWILDLTNDPKTAYLQTQEFLNHRHVRVDCTFLYSERSVCNGQKVYLLFKIHGIYDKRHFKLNFHHPWLSIHE